MIIATSIKSVWTYADPTVASSNYTRRYCADIVIFNFSNWIRARQLYFNLCPAGRNVKTENRTFHKHNYNTAKQMFSVISKGCWGCDMKLNYISSHSCYHCVGIIYFVERIAIGPFPFSLACEFLITVF